MSLSIPSKKTLQVQSPVQLDNRNKQRLRGVKDYCYTCSCSCHRTPAANWGEISNNLTLAQPQNPNSWAEGKNPLDILQEAATVINPDPRRKKASHEVKRKKKTKKTSLDLTFPSYYSPLTSIPLSIQAGPSLFFMAAK